MLIYALMLVAGLALGAWLGRQPAWLKATGKGLHYCVLALLFLIGMSVSADQQVRAQVPRLGLQAVTFAAATLGAAVLLAWGSERWQHRD